MRNIIKIVFVIIGTLIGAGFASGQEMYLFFFSYGIKGVMGIIISSTLMGIVIYHTLKIIKRNNIEDYKEFLEKLFPSKRKNKYQFFNMKYIINVIINSFILITFFIMIAGFGAYLEQQFAIPSLIGSTILVLLCFFVFMTSVKGVVKANEILIPIIIMILIIIGIINFKELHINEIENYIEETNFTNWIISSILYCSYNSILLIPALITLKNYIHKEKIAFPIGIIVTIITIVLSFIICSLLIRVDVDITKLEMPVVYVVSNGMKPFISIYGFVILASIFTTAISLGTSFLKNTSKNKKNYTPIAILMCITAILVSNIGFSNLVNSLYPIFGYLGLIQIIKILIVKVKKE